MRTLRHLTVVGVSAAIALGNVTPISAQTSPTSNTSPSPEASPPMDQVAPQADNTLVVPTTESIPTAPASTRDSGTTAQIPTLQPQPGKVPPASQSPALRPSSPSPSPTPTAPIPSAVPVLTPPPSTTATPEPVTTTDLTPLNPDPNRLSLPTQPEAVRLLSTQAITLQQALELALRNNQDLQVAQLQLQRSRFALQEAQASQLPNLDLNTSLSYQDSVQLRRTNAIAELENQGKPAFLQQSLSKTTSTTLNGTLELSYNLFTGGRIGANVRAAEQQVRVNELEVERLREQTLLDITGAYYDLQQADEQVRIAQAAVTNAQTSLRDAQALERAGVGTRFDVLRAEVQLANSNQDLTRAFSQQRISRRTLAQRLSVANTVNLSAADPVQVAGNWTTPLEDSILLAFRNRAELAQQLAQRELSVQQRQAILANLSPQISLFADYNFFDVFFDDPVSIKPGYALGVRLNWSLYDGGAIEARARQQEANIAIAETQFASVRNQVRLQVEQSYSNLQANFENIQTSSAALAQATESLRLARLRFQAGVGTQSDVINAETELTRSEVNRLTAILDYNRSLASLRRAISALSEQASPINTVPGTTPAPNPSTAPDPQVNPEPRPLINPAPGSETTPNSSPAPSSTPGTTL